MRYPAAMLLSFCILALAATGYAENKPLACAKKSLAEAVSDEKDQTIEFSGVCQGPIVIRTNGFSLNSADR